MTFRLLCAELFRVGSQARVTFPPFVYLLEVRIRSLGKGHDCLIGNKFLGSHVTQGARIGSGRISRQVSTFSLQYSDSLAKEVTLFKISRSSLCDTGQLSFQISYLII